jgi:hypothetical protein
MSDQDLELKDVVRKLREDLQAAAEEGQGKAIKFKLESIDLELKVAAKDVGEVNGGIKFYIFNAGSSGKSENEQSLTLKLKMTPQTPQGGTVQVAAESDDRPQVPGRR